MSGWPSKSLVRSVRESLLDSYRTVALSVPVFVCSAVLAELNGVIVAARRGWATNAVSRRRGNSSWIIYGSRIGVKIVGSSTHRGVTAFALYSKEVTRHVWLPRFFALDDATGDLPLRLIH